MKEILIVSGKGGTGKTSLAACFAQLTANAVFCDCDVDASNLPLLLKPTGAAKEAFYAGAEAEFDLTKCAGCGKCAELCRFNALAMKDGKPELTAVMCEGCGVCAMYCPAGAAVMVPRRRGEWFAASTAFGPLFYARLRPGGENSGKLVTRLRRAARAEAEKRHADYLVSDGPPGIGCPVISAMTGADLAVLVTEPTPSGLHGLERVAELARQFQLPVKAVVNKCDLNPEVTAAAEKFCGAHNIDVIGHIAYDPWFSEALRNAVTALSRPESGPAREIKRTWLKITSIFNQPWKGNEK